MVFVLHGCVWWEGWGEKKTDCTGGGFELESMSILPLLLVLLLCLGTQLIADATEDICSRLTPNDDGGDRGRRYLTEDVSNGSHGTLGGVGG